jgi:hypothetical protein
MNKFDLTYKNILENIDQNQAEYIPEQPDNEKLYNDLKNFLSKGAKFASFIYQTQGTADVKKGERPNGPTKRFVVNLGINYGNLKEHNLNVIQNYQPQDEYEEKAKAELIASLSKPFDPVANREKQDVYARDLGKGIRYNVVGDYFNILGQVQGKPELLAAGEEKPKKDINEIPLNKDGSPRGGDKAYIARAKRIIQNKLRNELRGGLTSYDLDPYKIGGIRLNGEIIEFHGKEGQNIPLNAVKS